MAKAQFHKHQRVWVDSVGAWAIVERLVPIWAKGFDEPVKITYDLGLGREFQGPELRAEAPGELGLSDDEGGDWRLLRARNKWQNAEDCSHHPHPGTFPVVVTDAADWGGWRTPGAEYDRDPRKIEFQARLIASAPRMLKLMRDLAATVGEDPDDAPPELLRLTKAANSILRYLSEQPPTGAPSTQAKLAAE